MRAKVITHNQRALRALIVLATNDHPRSPDFVAPGSPSALRLGKPLRLATRVGSCPTGCGGRHSGRCPCPTPLPIGSLASISIKGEGFARHPLPFALAALPCAAAFGVALDSDSSQGVISVDDENGMARMVACRQSFEYQPSPLAKTLCNLVARSVAKFG